MRQLNRGDIVKTSYGTGPYRVTNIIRDCTCPEYVRSLNGDRTPSQPHIHLTCKKIDHVDVGKKDVNSYWLNGYDEETLKSVWNNDELILCASAEPIQLELAI